MLVTEHTDGTHKKYGTSMMQKISFTAIEETQRRSCECRGSETVRQPHISEKRGSEAQAERCQKTKSVSNNEVPRNPSSSFSHGVADALAEISRVRLDKDHFPFTKLTEAATDAKYCPSLTGRYDEVDSILCSA